jgi:hypothetical protein
MRNDRLKALLTRYLGDLGGQSAAAQPADAVQRAKDLIAAMAQTILRIRRIPGIA